MESNSKGARLKTSSTSRKSKKQTVEKKQLKVLIMNASGPNQGKGTAARRKKTIIDVITRQNPDVILFQELSFTHVKPKSADPIPEYYQITGSRHASIMWNANELTVEENPKRKLQRILEELQRPTSKNPTPIPLEFTPISRMTLRVVETKGVPVMKFICISWHGKHARMSNKRKVTEFKNLMIFLEEIYDEYDLPLLIAGDFNVDIKLICHEVKEPFKLYEYKASERREKKRVIDYFIATEELHLPDITPVDLKKDSNAYKPEKVFDHDPITAMLELAPLSDTAPVLDKVTVKNSKKAK